MTNRSWKPSQLWFLFKRLSTRQLLFMTAANQLESCPSESLRNCSMKETHEKSRGCQIILLDQAVNATKMSERVKLESLQQAWHRKWAKCLNITSDAAIKSPIIDFCCDNDSIDDLFTNWPEAYWKIEVTVMNLFENLWFHEKIQKFSCHYSVISKQRHCDCVKSEFVCPLSLFFLDECVFWFLLSTENFFTYIHTLWAWPVNW